jgi:hypothetical protein
MIKLAKPSKTNFIYLRSNSSILLQFGEAELWFLEFRFFQPTEIRVPSGFRATLDTS